MFQLCGGTFHHSVLGTDSRIDTFDIYFQLFDGFEPEQFAQLSVAGNVLNMIVIFCVVPVLSGRLKWHETTCLTLINALNRDQLYKNRSSRKIYSRRLFSREYDFQKTFFRTENPFSGKTYFYTIASSTSYFAATFPTAIWPGMYLVEVLNASSFSQYSQARYASQVPSPTTGCPRFLCLPDATVQRWHCKWVNWRNSQFKVNEIQSLTAMVTLYKESKFLS